MSDSSCQRVDPRVRRTRLLLHDALGKLMETKDFAKISVQDVVDAAMLNRATFYDHYPDKYFLLQCMVGSRFDELLKQREVKFDGTCAFAVKAIVLALCDYLAATLRLECERQPQVEPSLESAIIAVVRTMILHGLQQHPPTCAISVEMIATTVSWAIYGAVKEWLQTPKRCSSEEVASMVTMLVIPLLKPKAQVETGTDPLPVGNPKSNKQRRHQ